MEKLKVESKQVVNGLEYKGTIEINEKVFGYQLKFGFPINELNGLSFPKEPESAKKFSREIFQFSLKKGEQEIEIDDVLFGFLVGVAGYTTLNLYNNPQTIKINKGILSNFLKKASRGASNSGIGMEIALSSEFFFDKENIPNALKS